jgi:hypothetical protein
MMLHQISHLLFFFKNKCWFQTAIIGFTEETQLYINMSQETLITLSSTFFSVSYTQMFLIIFQARQISEDHPKTLKMP